MFSQYRGLSKTIKSQVSSCFGAHANIQWPSANPATVPEKGSRDRVFFQKCLAALGTLPAECVTGFSEMMGPLSQFLFGLVMLGTLPGNRAQK